MAKLTVAEVGPARRILGKAAVVVAVFIVAGLIAKAVYRRSRPAERLTEKDIVLLVDFLNTTGDSVFDDTLKQALSISLNQSPQRSLRKQGHGCFAHDGTSRRQASHSRSR